MSVQSIISLAKILVLISATGSIGQVLNEEVQIAIENSADSICGVYERESYQRTATVDSAATAELQGLARALANLELSVEGNINIQEASGVLHEALDEEFESIRLCRLAVFQTIVSLVKSESPKREESPSTATREITTTTTSEYRRGQGIICKIKNDSPYILEITSIEFMRNKNNNLERIASVVCENDCLVASGETRTKSFRIVTQDSSMKCKFIKKSLP